MSSGEDDSNDGNHFGRDAKKRRVQRACDMCRRKKGDGGQMPGNRCSNCIAYNQECTYVEAAKKRGPPKGYVEGLETRLEKMQALLNQLCPNADFSKELGPPVDRDWTRERQSSYSEGRPQASTPPYRESPMTFPIPASNTDALEPSDDEEALQVDGLADHLKDFHVGYRFFGKSSGVRLIKTAMDFKSEYSGKRIDEYVFNRNANREEFWSVHPWENLANCHDFATSRPYVFPEPDLLTSLVSLYFEHSNSLYPLLHRPTFERQMLEGLHMEDEGFGSVVIVACSIGSRYSDDPRVRLDGVESFGSSGWKWFLQVRMARRSFLTPPTLTDLQIFCLTCIFLQGCSAPQVCWTLCGVGIRLAQDVGAHRRKVYSSRRKVEDELWRRAFWVLVTIDRSMSASLGRPCAIQEEDFDLDYPAECDDEYWEHPDPNQAFKQPAGKPSTVSFFLAHIRLDQIMGFALRTIYSINKSKALLGFVGPEWEQRIVAELDSTLNKWVDEIPDHLRWPPSTDQPLFFRQSAVLYAEYYQLQIMVHRPFIPSAQKPSKLSFPSLAICTNAARACAHVVDALRRRFPGRRSPELQLPIFTAAIVLLLYIWGHKRAGQSSTSVDFQQEMQSVHKCMQTLKDCESRWHTAGRLWDVIYELASVGEIPLPASTPTSKRERDSDSP
ncbi:fungal-specific transcription factor domain-containing protein, partial [Vararia minispora EC-137]